MAKILFWTPRVLMIIFIAFISLFALDSFEGDKNLIKKLLGFIIHLIPTFILILLLIISWRRELIGSLACFLLAVSYLIMTWGNFPLSTYLLISGPLFLVSVLFGLNWIKRKKHNNQQSKL